jgi:ribosomal-protein-alanine N-acetyltransferase
MNLLLETHRLLLRPLCEADREHVIALNTNLDVIRYIAPGEQPTGDEASAWFDKVSRETGQPIPARSDGGSLPGWMVIETTSGRDWVGLAALRVLSPHHLMALGIEPQVEVGYRLHPAYWGNGYATDAAALLAQHGFEMLGLPLIAAIVNIENAPSNRVIQKLGFTHERVYECSNQRINYYTLSRDSFFQQRRAAMVSR